MDFSLMEMWHQMGFAARAVVVVLALMSIQLVAVGVERWRLFKKSRRACTALLDDVRGMFESSAGWSATKVLAAVNKHGESPLAAVVGAAARAFDKRRAAIDAMDLVVGINRAVERTIERETSSLKRGLGGMATIASTAPFVGLFGTVVGIINAFQNMAVTGGGGLASVSAGISEALVATAFGLLVAIPAVGLYNYFNGVVDGFVVDMDEVSSELVEAVLLHVQAGGAAVGVQPIVVSEAVASAGQAGRGPAAGDSASDQSHKGSDTAQQVEAA